MFDRRLLENFDWGLLLITFLLCVIGIFNLYSAVNIGVSSFKQALWLKQIIWFGFGFGIMATSFFFNYKLLDRWGMIIYIGCIVMLVFVLIFGKYVAGSRRWIVFGPITVQPSELVKIAVIIILARYYSRHAHVNGFTLRELIVPFLLIMAPVCLILKQPDLGTSMLIILIAASMTLFVKIEKRSLIYIVIACFIAGPLIWFLLKGYQKQRILTFLNPDLDPLGAGYHIIQSKIAIGSGMFTGKGFLKGTQKALSFLPEQHTDFILSVLSEEWGFVGSVATILIYLLLILWGINIAYRCRDPFGIIIAQGIVGMFALQVFINTSMVMGLMPVVGVPLPLISYGGSSVITSMLGIGILMNISMRRFMKE